MNYTITVSENQVKALKVIAEKEGKTPKQVVIDILNRYITAILNEYISDTSGLTDTQKVELKATLTNAKADYLKTL